MDLDLSFGDKMMITPVYIKMGATTPLLLSESVCQQLGILYYHTSIGDDKKKECNDEQWRENDEVENLSDHVQESVPIKEAKESKATESNIIAVVPMVHVHLTKWVKLLPRKATPVSVSLDMIDLEGPLIVEPNSSSKVDNSHVDDTIFDASVSTISLLV